MILPLVPKLLLRNPDGGKSSCFFTLSMRTRYKITDKDQPYFITSTIVEWLPVFTRKPYFDIIINTLNFYRQNKGLKVFAYEIMDNHLHLIAASDDFPKILKEFKSFTAREIVRIAEEENKTWLLNQFRFFKQERKKSSNYQVWQEGFHPKQITSEEMLRQKIEYLHHNPVRAGLVVKAEDWVYSSAGNYAGLPGPLEVDILEI